MIGREEGWGHGEIDEVYRLTLCHCPHKLFGCVAALEGLELTFFVGLRLVVLNRRRETLVAETPYRDIGGDGNMDLAATCPTPYGASFYR